MIKILSLGFYSKCIIIIHTFLALFSSSIYANYNDLIAPDGFKVELYASNILAPRQMVEGKEYIYVGGIKGEISAINKKIRR